MSTLCITFTRQLVCLILASSCISCHDIDSFASIKDLQDPSTDLFEEFKIYLKYQDGLTNPFS